MKKITLLLSFIACVLVSQAGTPLFVEDFNYVAPSDLLAQGGWAVTGTNSAAPFIQVTTSSINYSGYIGSGVGNEATLTNGQDLNKNFTAQTSGSVYVSFLVNVVAAPTGGEYFLHVGPTDMAGNAYLARTFAKKHVVNSKVSFGILQASGGVATYTDSIYNLNTTYLIVLKHDVGAKASSITVNPVLGTEPTSNWISNATGTNTTANVGSLGLRQPSASAALTAKIDGIRVATSWADLFTATSLSTPSADILEVSMAGNKLTVTNSPSSTVEIFNTVGAKVQSVVLTNNSADLNLGKGLYIVRVGGKSAKIRL